MLDRLRHSKALPFAVPIGLFVLLALQATWPWVLHPGDRISAPVGGDVSGGIAKWGVLAREHSMPWSAGSLHTIGWPFGVVKPSSLDAVSILSSIPLWVGSMVFGPVATHGLMAVFGYVLTATVAFLFVRRVTGSPLAGAVAAIAYGFFPHMRAMAVSDVMYQHMWLYLLPLWALWELARRPGRRPAAIAGASVLPAMFWTPYYTEHVAVVFASALLALLLMSPRLALSPRVLVLTVVPLVVGAVVQLAIGSSTGFTDAPDRGIADFYNQSAHPLMYVMPGAGSTWTGGGHWAADWLFDRLTSAVPRAELINLYVGYSVIALALVALVKVVVPWLRGRTQEHQGIAVAGVLAGAVVIGTFVFSLPPRVGILGVSVPLPAQLVYDFQPGFRSGQRFVMPLMGGLSVLAGIGAWQLLRGFSGVKAVALATALCAVVLVDLTAHYAGQWGPNLLETPAIRTLARAPAGPAAETIGGGVLGGAPQEPCLLQAYHHKTLYNPCGIHLWGGPTYAIAIKAPCDVLDDLRRRGLRYLINKPEDRPDLTGQCMAHDRRLRQARLLAADGTYRVWEFPAAV